MIRIQVDGTIHEFSLTSGYLKLTDSNKIIVMSVVYKVPPKVLQVKAKSSSTFEYLTSIRYSDAVTSEQYHVERDATQKKAIDVSGQRIYFMHL